MLLDHHQPHATTLQHCAISHVGFCGVLHLQRPAVADEFDVHAAGQSFIENAGSQNSGKSHAQRAKTVP